MPLATWGEKTGGTEVAQHLSDNIKGRVVVITGVSPKSLGETLALIIASHEPERLVLASRTMTKLQQVAEKIAEEAPNCKVDLVELDLSSQAAVRRAAEEISAKVDRIDVLLNNAAVVTSERQETSDGLELQFGTNHIGHFLLTSLLTPLLMRSARGLYGHGSTRVVNTTSAGYIISPVRFHDYNFTGETVPEDEQPPSFISDSMRPDPAAKRYYHGFTAYGQSKTANILHALEINERYGEAGIRAFAVHPGSIWTDLSRNLNPDDYAFIEGTNTFWKSTDQGVAPILTAAFDPDLDPAQGVYVADCQVADTAKHAKDPVLAERLWRLSEDLTATFTKL